MIVCQILRYAGGVAATHDALPAEEFLLSAGNMLLSVACVEIQKMIIHILLYRYNSCSCRTLQMVVCITCNSAILILMLTTEFSLIWSRIYSLWSGVWMLLPFESEFSAVFVTQRYCVRKIPALVRILNDMNLDCAIPSCFWKYILILSSSIHQGHCKWFLSFRFLHRNLVSPSLLPHMYHMIHASLSSLYHRPNNFGKDFTLWCSALCSFSIFFLLSVSQMQISSWAPCFHIHLCLSLTQIFTFSTCGKTIFRSRSRQIVCLVVASKKKCTETEQWYQPCFNSCT